MPGFGELLVLLVIIIILFGASRIPKIGDSLGKGIRNFSAALKGQSNDVKSTDTPSQPPATSQEEEDTSDKTT